MKAIFTGEPRHGPTAAHAAEGSGPSSFISHPLFAGVMLTLFVAMAIVVVGAELARGQVSDKVGEAHTRDLDALNGALHSAEALNLSDPRSRDNVRVIAATADFEAALRKAMFGVDASQIDVFSIEGDRIFSSSPTTGYQQSGEGRVAFEKARRGETASALQTGGASGASALTTYSLITDAKPESGLNGRSLMVVALTTDVTDDIATAQQAVWWTAGTFGGGLLFIVGVIYWASERSRKRLQTLNAALAVQNAAVRESRERMLAAADATKRAIAEELHGAVQTKLYAAWVKLGDIRGRLPQGAAASAAELDRLGEELDRIRDEDIRALSHRLHPSIVRVSASAGLRSLAEYYTKVVPVELLMGDGISELEPAGASKLPERLRLAIYRTAELALGNVARHAQAAHCVMRFDYSAASHELTLIVHDDGKGFDMATAKPTGIGVVTMSDYADSLGGSLRVESSPGNGTRITVKAPFTAEYAATATGGYGAKTRLTGLAGIGAPAQAAGG